MAQPNWTWTRNKKKKKKRAVISAAGILKKGRTGESRNSTQRNERARSGFGGKPSSGLSSTIRKPSGCLTTGAGGSIGRGPTTSGGGGEVRGRMRTGEGAAGARCTGTELVRKIRGIESQARAPTFHGVGVDTFFAISALAFQKVPANSLIYQMLGT